MLSPNNIIVLARFVNLYERLNGFVKVAYIRKLPNGKYRVFSEKGKNLGTYSTHEEAKKRLRQIEFFKHKKASKDIDLSNLDTDNISYSSIARELNKTDIHLAIDFMKLYKECFDKLVLENNEKAADIALAKTLFKFCKSYNIKMPNHIKIPK